MSQEMVTKQKEVRDCQLANGFQYGLEHDPIDAVKRSAVEAGLQQPQQYKLAGFGQLPKEQKQAGLNRVCGEWGCLDVSAVWIGYIEGSCE